MFAQDSSITYVPTQSDHVIDIYNSINRSMVAPPGMVPESSQCFIATIYREGAYEVVIYLYLATSNQGIIYSWDEGPVAAERVNDLYQMAFQFAESMGFMMDDMRYREKSQDEKDQAFSQVPMFHQDLSGFSSGEAAPAEEASEELLLESIEEEPVEVVAEEAEEINLDVLGEGPELAAEEVQLEPEPVEEVTLGGAAADDIQLDPGAVDEEITLETAEPPPPPAELEEEIALSAFDEPAPEPAPALAPEPAPELAPEPAPEAVEGVEEIMLDEQTLEAAPMLDAMEEPALTPEEARVLGGVEAAAPAPAMVEEISLDDFAASEPEPAPEPAPAPEPMADEVPMEMEMDLAAPPLEAEPAPEPAPEPEPESVPSYESAPPAAEPTEIPSDLSPGDFKILVSFLAMF